MPNAEIKSPEFVRDCDTNSLREVDIGVRLKQGSGNVFIAIECRDRSSTQDITWIEQLISKKNSINADVLIAVTSSKFTKPAMIKAAKNGVAIRKYEDFSTNEVIAWANETYIEVHSIEKKVKGIQILTVDQITLKKPLNEYSFYNEEQNVEMSFDQITYLLAQDNAYLKVKDKFKKHGDKVEFNVELTIDKIFIILSPKVKVKVKKAIMHLVAVNNIRRLPLSSGFNYVNPQTGALLAEGYNYNSNMVNSSKILVDSETNASEWKLNYQSLINDGEVIYAVIVKCKNPIILENLSLSSNRI